MRRYVETKAAYVLLSTVTSSNYIPHRSCVGTNKTRFNRSLWRLCRGVLCKRPRQGGTRLSPLRINHLKSLKTNVESVARLCVGGKRSWTAPVFHFCGGRRLRSCGRGWQWSGTAAVRCHQKSECIHTPDALAIFRPFQGIESPLERVNGLKAAVLVSQSGILFHAATSTRKYIAQTV